MEVPALAMILRLTSRPSPAHPPTWTKRGSYFGNGLDTGLWHPTFRKVWRLIFRRLNWDLLFVTRCNPPPPPWQRSGGWPPAAVLPGPDGGHRPWRWPGDWPPVVRPAAFWWGWSPGTGGPQPSSTWSGGRGPVPATYAAPCEEINLRFPIPYV
jgi:hypothetical protein